MRSRHRALVRWDDLDAMSHVNNAKYLTLAQEARFEWSFSSHVSKGEIPGILEMVVARAEIDFVAPILQGGIFVDVELWVESIGSSSFVMAYEIKSEKEIYARIKSVQVAIDKNSGRSRPLEASERSFLEKYLEVKS
ncbi:MAG: acyl-CoA thioesterase [Actinobacteria bacterium]|nr:acyl-CoA thioesterase [Actinomycetota bacterium]